MQVTKHAKQRGKERIGLSEKAMQRQAKEAILYGTQINDAPVSLARHLRSKIRDHPKIRTLYVYHRNIYVIEHPDILVTILPLDKRFWTMADKLNKKRKEVQENVTNSRL